MERFGDLTAWETSGGTWEVQIGDTSATLGVVHAFGPFWFGAFHHSGDARIQPVLVGWAPSLGEAVALFDRPAAG